MGDVFSKHRVWKEDSQDVIPCIYSGMHQWNQAKIQWQVETAYLSVCLEAT